MSQIALREDVSTLKLELDGLSGAVQDILVTLQHMVNNPPKSPERIAPPLPPPPVAMGSPVNYMTAAISSPIRVGTPSRQLGDPVADAVNAIDDVIGTLRGRRSVPRSSLYQPYQNIRWSK